METKDILKALRKEKGFSTMQEFCNVSGISFSTYQNYEAGKRLPTAEILMQIAKFYGVTTDYILGIDTAPNPVQLLTQEQLERRLVAAYFQLPQKVRADFLHGMAAELEKQRELAEGTGAEEENCCSLADLCCCGCSGAWRGIGEGNTVDRAAYEDCL